MGLCSSQLFFIYYTKPPPLWLKLKGSQSLLYFYDYSTNKIAHLANRDNNHVGFSFDYIFHKFGKQKHKKDIILSATQFFINMGCFIDHLKVNENLNYDPNKIHFEKLKQSFEYRLKYTILKDENIEYFNIETLQNLYDNFPNKTFFYDYDQQLKDIIKQTVSKILEKQTIENQISPKKQYKKQTL